MDNDDQKAVDALMAAQRKNRKIVPCPECERLQEQIDLKNKSLKMYEEDIRSLRAALDEIESYGGAQGLIERT
jgi:hypothetical protein